MPAVFLTSKKDTVVPAEMTEEIYSKYSNQKLMIYVEGEHNSPRDPKMVKDIF